MSEFATFTSLGFADALRTVGTDSFTVAGLPGTFAGVLDQHSEEQELHDEGGGLIATFNATLVCALAQFTAAPLNGAEITCLGKIYAIVHVDRDSLSYTLRLANAVS